MSFGVKVNLDEPIETDNQSLNETDTQQLENSAKKDIIDKAIEADSKEDADNIEKPDDKKVDLKDNAIADDKKVDDKKPDNEKKPTDKEDEKKPSIDDDQLLNLLKEKSGRKDVSSLEDFFKVQEKEVEKIVNPYEDVIDEETKAFLDYRKETGRSRKEWEFIQKDVNSVSNLDFAKQQVEKDTGMQLSEVELKEYLENSLDIDFSEEQLSTTDKIKLNAFVKKTRDSFIDDQDKFKKPLEDNLRNKPQTEQGPEMVELENGFKIEKEKYENLINQQKSYRELVSKEVDSVASIEFSTEVDDNGDKRKIDFSYELSEQDKQSMMSVEDVDKLIKDFYQTEDGLNVKQLGIDTWRGREENFNRLVSLAMEKARAEAIEEVLSQNNNENFSARPLPKTKTSNDGYGSLPNGEETRTGFGVKIGL